MLTDEDVVYDRLQTNYLRNKGFSRAVAAAAVRGQAQLDDSVGRYVRERLYKKAETFVKGNDWILSMYRKEADFYLDLLAATLKL